MPPKQLAHLLSENYTQTKIKLAEFASFSRAQTKMGESRNEFIHLAKLAEQTERFEDVIFFMRKVVEINPELSKEQRNLLAVGYKNVVGTKRFAWRLLHGEIQKSPQSESKLKMAKKYKAKVESELKKLCNEILELLENHLSTSDIVTRVFYDKMTGDYNRYLAEILADKEQEDAKVRSLAAYEQATVTAAEYLIVTDPVRLGLALNFSVFYKEIMNEPEKAVMHSKEAYDVAFHEMDNLCEEEYRDSNLIMHLLNENIALWSEER